jgi:hypothetical protein
VSSHITNCHYDKMDGMSVGSVGGHPDAIESQESNARSGSGVVDCGA